MLIKIKEEYIIEFINSWAIPMLPNEIIKKYLIFFICITLPIAFLGSFRQITMPLLLISILSMSIWAFSIYKNIDKHKRRVDLFIGVMMSLMSFVLMIGSYKLMVTFRKVDFIEICFVVISYMILVLFLLVFFVNRIIKGYFTKKKINPIGVSIISSAAMFGGIAGRSLSRNISENSTVALLAYVSLLMAYIFSFASLYILKYYLIVRLDVKNKQ